MKCSLDVWQNDDGWHWSVDAPNWQLTAQHTYPTRKLAVASARAICSGLRRAKVDLVSYEDD